MPYLKVTTNLDISESDRSEFLKQASDTVSQMLSKPERYVLVEVCTGQNLSMSGTTDPVAYVELKSIGLPEKKTSGFSSDLCKFLQDALGLDPERVYIEFTDIPRHLWGWNNGTF
ncbi:MAG: hypothetical protein K0U68_14210 [Gammaproteobacteria bacterium]|nr:hypothetical protein [Gammaproteobacteria bacterium]